ncbi:MAG TPA: SHOCT domain-containing protein [Vicingus sp.]|nr:SHOCT domain-containing protein [Vicingus sp.]
MKSLEYTTKKGDVHFRLACAYSMLKNINESLFHLSKSIENGFTDIEKINNSTSLEFLREKTEYKDFVSNGYKISSNTNKVESISIADELTKLNDLKEKGVISEIEFNTQKSKILAKG